MQGVDDIVLKVISGACHRLADITMSGEMDHRLDVVIVQYLRQFAALGKVALNEWTPANRGAVTDVEIVENHGLKAVLRKILGGMAANVPSTPRDQNP